MHFAFHAFLSLYLLTGSGLGGQGPRQWDLKHNPAYAYYTYYIYANLYTLNKLREARGLNTFALRPHAGASPILHSVVLLFGRS